MPMLEWTCTCGKKLGTTVANGTMSCSCGKSYGIRKGKLVKKGST